MTTQCTITDDSSRVERFMAKVDKTDACWLWTGYVDPKGYGRFSRSRAHRVAHELFVGPIPDGLTIDHLCRVRHCVNPAHLEPVTNRENVLRGEGITAMQARRTHCPYGHPYAGENLYVERGHRKCRECTRARKRRYYRVSLIQAEQVRPVTTGNKPRPRLDPLSSPGGRAARGGLAATPFNAAGAANPSSGSAAPARREV